MRTHCVDLAKLTHEHFLLGEEWSVIGGTILFYRVDNFLC